MADWTETHRPETLSAIRGNDSARDDLREWAETWDDHREAAVVHGSPGVGKTSAAHALAADMDWPVMEMNASDQRTGDVVERVAGEAARSGTLGQVQQGTPGRRLVVVDEADNLHGNADRGGSRAITSLVREAGQPVVLIANDFYDMSKTLRSNCREIEFRDVSARSIVPALRNVCRREGIEFESAALEAIAESTDGDLRSAINDLQAVAEGREELTEEMVVTGERDRTKGIFEFLDAALKEAGAQEALHAAYDTDETPDDLLNWVEDNLPKEYEGAELRRAYRHVATADRWLGRVRATQEYSYWRYATDAVAAGVASARDRPHGGWTRWSPPSFWSKLGRTKATREQRDDVARRIAATTGTSVAVARRSVLPYLAAMTHHCKNRELTVAMAAHYEMDAGDVAFVTGSGESTNKVESIVADARDLREEAAAEAAGLFDTRSAAEAEAEGGDGDDAGDDEEDATTDLDSFGDDEDGDDDPDPDDRAEAAADDDQQAGLGDFV